MTETTGQNASSYGKGYGKRPLWQWILIYIIIAAIVYGLIYYFVLGKRGGYKTQYPNQPTTQSTAQPTSTPMASPSATTVKEVTVEGNEFAFTPSKLTLTKGEEVKLTFKNTGKFPHNFTISDLQVQTNTVKPGESDTITFTPGKTGTFQYICTIDSHAARGMTGTLTVE